MLYAVSYTQYFSAKADEAAYQRELAQRLLSFAMKREYGAALSSLKIVRDPHGKPSFSDHNACFSLSHCSGLVCCALGDRELGVDAERVRPFHLRLARRICTAEEMRYLDSASDKGRALMELWTLKESLMKLMGEGIRYGFQNAGFSFEQGKPLPPLPGVQAAVYPAFPDYVLSVCCRGTPPKAVEPVKLEQLF